MTFAWIRDNPHGWPVGVTCEVLEVARSGYYAFGSRAAAGKPSPREQRHRTLRERVRLSHLRSRGAYGAPRIAAELIGSGTRVCVNTVAKLLRECGLKARKKRRFVPKTTDSAHGHPIAPNRLNRSFKVEGPDKLWVGDISYIPTREEGFLYLATLMDCCSRKIVGWAMSRQLTAQQLSCAALKMAIDRRRPPAGLIVHSDRGVQYACRQYRQLIEKHGLVASMSRKGDCYDNAPAESFFATLKGELVDGHGFGTRDQAKAAVFEFIEVFYNRKRLHSALGYTSPERFEADYHRASQKPAPTESG
jgi:putative transposase